GGLNAPTRGHLDTPTQPSVLEATMKKTNTLLVLGSAVVLLGSCDRGPAPGALPPSGSSAIPTTSARDSAVSAYRAMWNGFAEAGNTSDPTSPVLAQHASGAALEKLRRSLQSDREKGVVTKGKPVLDPKVSEADPVGDPKKITITDCGDSTNWLKYGKDNGLRADAAGGRRLIKASVDKQSDGSWKVSDYAVHEIGSC
ncbi:hypothetical protein ABZX92_45325, partial [Lentzea sp. NPDC006480]|uniref:hypothetical protein n=1 Tax=Lentzea sp. NPDC006480 TaxID=3157176 RepID=UPI0033B23AD3